MGKHKTALKEAIRDKMIGHILEAIGVEHKIERTQQLHKAARRYTAAQQANRAIEQHNFDKLVAQGTIVEGGPKKRLNPH